MERRVLVEFEGPDRRIVAGAPRIGHVQAETVLRGDFRQIAAMGMGQLNFADALVFSCVVRVGGVAVVDPNAEVPTVLRRRRMHTLRPEGAGRGNGKAEPKISRKDARRDAAAARAKIAPLRRKVEAMEKRHEKLQLDLATIEASINDPALYEDINDNTEKLAELTKRQADLERDLKDVEFEWMKALDEYEKAESGEVG